VLEYQVPRREVRARILLDDGRILDCLVFTAATAPDGGPQRVLDRLNETDEEFVPVSCRDDRFLVNKSGIVTVQITQPDEIAALSDAGAIERAVRLSLAGGINLVGRFQISMPPERSRVIDFLNAAKRFVPLLGPDRVTLVQRNYIVAVRSPT